MRFIMMMIPAVYQPQGSGPKVDAGFTPDADAVARMTKYNEELAKSGAMLSGDGFMPPDAGARITFPGGKPTVAQGPWPDAKDVVGGFWMIQVGSKEEAVEWARRVPCEEGDMIEVRVLRVDPDERKVGLSRKKVTDDSAAEAGGEAATDPGRQPNRPLRGGTGSDVGQVFSLPESTDKTAQS